MADTGIFCTTAEVARKAGANASSVSVAEAYVNDYVSQAESYINVVTRNNYSDTYSTLNADVKGILKECASSLAATYVINYDMSGFTSRQEALQMINVLWARVNICIQLLKDKKATDFVDGA